MGGLLSDGAGLRVVASTSAGVAVGRGVEAGGLGIGVGVTWLGCDFGSGAGGAIGV